MNYMWENVVPHRVLRDKVPRVLRLGRGFNGDRQWAEEEFSTAPRWRGREGEGMDGQIAISGNETTKLKLEIACWRWMSYL